mmetsp:Transcript_13328/g.35398  ORF Transcript_13328/g.35398 Transcript_13328/m.35398 type:complete len:408 (-) Transcript_13328:20-1243(-)
MSGFTCLTAPGVVFDDKAAFTAHYKSEWHRYNLKRRTAQLPMVSLEEFERRRAAAQEASPAPKGQAHVKANKREKRSKRRELKGASVVDSVPGYRSSLNVADGPASKPTEDVNEESEEEEIEEVTAEARCTDSFFDNERFDSSEEALAYMHRTYGFVLPESPYIADVDGLALYLCSKIKQGRTCLWCGRQFRSYRACQQHMIDKSHVKVAYESDAAVDELSDYYDFSASYVGMDDDAVKALGVDDDEADDDSEDGWETASSTSDVEIVQRRAPKVKVLGTGELLLRSNGRKKIVGARWLRSYYRQNHRLDDERDATVAVRAEQRDRLLAAYGREHHERGGFLLGLAAQYNRRTVFKQLARDQRAQNRMEMRTAGFRSGGKAKDFKQNKLIKHAVAGKNRGEGLGVHG